MHSRLSSHMQRAYDDTHLICSTAIHFEQQNNKKDALISWKNALSRIRKFNVHRMPSHYLPASEAEKALYESLQRLEFRCKQRIDDMETLDINAAQRRNERDEVELQESRNLEAHKIERERWKGSEPSQPLGGATDSISSSNDREETSRPILPRASSHSYSSSFQHHNPDSKGASQVQHEHRSVSTFDSRKFPPRPVRNPNTERRTKLLRTLRSNSTENSRASSPKPIKSASARPPAAAKAANQAWDSIVKSKGGFDRNSSRGDESSAISSLASNLRAKGKDPSAIKSENPLENAGRRPDITTDVTNIHLTNQSSGCLKQNDCASNSSDSDAKFEDTDHIPSQWTHSSGPDTLLLSKSVSNTSESDKQLSHHHPAEKGKSCAKDCQRAYYRSLPNHSNSRNKMEPILSKYDIGTNIDSSITTRNYGGSNHSQHSSMSLDSDFHRSRESEPFNDNVNTSGSSHPETARKATQGRSNLSSVQSATRVSNFSDDRARKVMDNLPSGVDEAAATQILSEIIVHGDEVHWQDIAGLDIAKIALKETVVYPFLRPDLFVGLREPARGMLLFGPPGTGKTMLARAVATESRSTFFSISASSLTSKFLGESEKLVRALFSLAKLLTPSIIFVDEIDSILSERSSSGEIDATRRLKTEFLIQWSSLAKAAAGKGSEAVANDRSDAHRVLVLAATNMPWAIDEAARRRFVRRQYIPLPEADVRKLQLRALLGHQKHSLTEDDFNELVILTDGFSGSDITSLAKDAAMGPLRTLGELLLQMKMDEIRPIQMQDFHASLTTIRPSVSKQGLERFDQWARDFGERAG